ARRAARAAGRRPPGSTPGARAGSGEARGGARPGTPDTAAVAGRALEPPGFAGRQGRDTGAARIEGISKCQPGARARRARAARPTGAERRAWAHAGRAGSPGRPPRGAPLATRDPRFSDYFDQLRRAIKDKWSYPREAADKNIGGQLMLEFGIAKDGELRFIELRRSSGVAVLDDYAMNAVKLASPFPRVPDEMSRGGIPVLAIFNYIVAGSPYNVLR